MQPRSRISRTDPTLRAPFLLLALAALSLALGACGDDGGGDGGNDSGMDSMSGSDANDGGSDAPPVPCGARLDPLPDGSGNLGGGNDPAIVISEVKPGAYIEIYNSTDQPFSLKTQAAGWQWCSFPAYRAVSGNDITLPPLSYAMVPYVGTNTESDGEMVIYLSSAYSTPTQVLDYVCWGSTRTVRKMPAEMATKWSGACAPSIPAGGAIHRKIGTQGTSAADYDVTLPPSGTTCTPDPPSADGGTD